MHLLACTALAVGISSALASQVVLDTPQSTAQRQFRHDSDKWTVFNSTIERVAVIGAGPAGLQAAAALIEHNFTVRMFDRAPGPGGNWLYTDEIPTREAYPDGDVYTLPWLPDTLPATVYFNEGEDGLSLSERWREHWKPSSIWHSLHTNSPSVITGLEEVPYPPDHSWILSAHTISAHVRAYASLKSLNANDNSTVHSYSTRVETFEKVGLKWRLTLRHLKYLSHTNRLKATYWTEDFDALVIAAGPFQEPHVPDIDGLLQWSQVVCPDDHSRFSMHHSRVYRRPERYAGKNVLIVGVGTSASELARDLAPHVNKLYASRKEYDWDKLHPFQRRSIRRFPPETEFIPQISKFKPLNSLSNGLKSGNIELVNGSILTGIDEIILATGYNRTNPFLAKAIRDNPGAPPAESAPSGKPYEKGFENLHWTGNYIPDPTLAFTTVRPWTAGKWQSQGFAKIWKGTARIPKETELWRQFNMTRYSNFRGLYGSGPSQAIEKQYVAWLNNEALELGGRLHYPPPLWIREAFVYYSKLEWEKEYVTMDNFTRFDELPANEWSKSDYLWDVLAMEDSFW